MNLAVLDTSGVDEALARRLAGERRTGRILAIGVPIVAVLGALGVGAVLMGLDGINPLAVYGEVVRAVFSAPHGLSDTAIQATPLIFLGLGLTIAYRAGVFTIGAEGQYIVGAVAAVAWATAPGVRTLPGFVIIVSALVVGAAGGAIWGAVPGVLSARFGTSVVISSLLLNYLGAALLAWAVRVGIRDPKGFVPQSRVIGKAALPVFGPNDVHIGFLLALVLVPVLSVVMARSRAAFRIDVMGDNPGALAANELPPARVTIGVLLACGATAGIAGFVQVAGVTTRLNPSFSIGYGFTAIVVALLGRLRPVWVLVAALGLSALTIGFDVAERKYRIPSATVGVIQALIVVFFVAGDALASRHATT